jgi:hypothetical protein
MTEEEVIAALKKRRNELLKDAASVAYEYAAACDLGTEREKAFEIYENIRNAGRVY